jgi:hypothetical protein
MIDRSFVQSSETSGDFERIVALVKREAAEECAAGACLVAPMLDRCVRESVSAFDASRIRSYVPSLALRRVRGCIRAGHCDGDDC